MAALLQPPLPLAAPLPPAGAVASGEHEANPQWLIELIAYVARWPRASLLYLVGLGEDSPVVSVRLQDGRLQGVCIESDRSLRVSTALGVLDACAYFACGDGPRRRRFRYAVYAAPPGMMGEGSLDWAIGPFCIMLANFCDVLSEEEPQIAGGITARRYRLAGPDSGGRAETDDEKLFLAALGEALRPDGGGLDAAEAGRLADVSARTAALLLVRLWRTGVLTDRVP